jgi:tetratricopeptide (TPR) repeat protein
MAHARWLEAARARRIVVALIVASALLGRPADVWAQQTPREKARAKLIEGARLLQKGSFQAALARFEAARAIFPSAKIYYNIALAYRALEKPAQAVTALNRLLRDPGDATPELLGEARAMVQQLSSRITWVSVVSDVDATDLSLDGVPVEKTHGPTRLAVDPGAHELTIRSRTLGSRTRTFMAVAGESLELKFEFQSKDGSGASSAASRSTQSKERPSAAAQAEALIREATELRKQSKDARAYPLLLKAYETETTARTAAQLGLVEIQLGYWLAAERHLSESLAASRDPWVTSNRADLEASLTKARAAIGEIMVTGSPPGATVTVNGWRAGQLPLSAPIRSGEGPLNLEIRAEGFAPLQRSLIVAGGKRQEITVEMERVGGSPGPGKNGAAPVTDSSLSESATGESNWRPRLRPFAWTAAALAAGSVGLGIYETFAWRKKFDQFEAYEAPATTGSPTVQRTCGADDPGHGAPGCDGIYRQMQLAKRLAIAGYALSGVLAAGSVALFVLPRIDRAPSDMACAPTVGLPGASCRFHF